ncbi:hypothetical protein [Ovoidimarina sediminis]|uniref:hypothetical protein n=1 Tax=Ovoidimarina sediminis TaxID=3079856 RepID=UPI002908E220|nr:hypothetical protein [Rhodophyticola sp. MJ-SS7]MDU8942309.1 hypothetical protein [Rhodophyticola sp. MJ-SS7]
MTTRRSMTFGDWVNAAALAAVGLFLGLALHYLFQLKSSAFWVTGIVTLLLFGGVFLASLAFDAAVDRLFFGGVKPADPPEGWRRKPLPRLLSLPAGVAIGVIGGQFGLGALLL